MAKKKKRPLPQSLGLECVGVDHHAHLDLEGMREDLDGVLQRARESGFAQVGNVFLGPTAYEKNRELFAERTEVFFQLAVHPNDAGKAEPDSLPRLEAAFGADPRLKAMGEIGLDHYWDKAPRDVQERLFREQLQLARQLDLPVVIHCRDAVEDTMRVLEEEGFRDRPLIWHCFGEDADLAGRIVANGWLVSIPGTITYRKSEAQARAVAATDLSRLLVETDCPFLTPEPWRGKRNEPALAAFSVARIAEIKGLDTALVHKTLGANARRFFNLD